jgi:HCOMODA/2-hydroxy-3-carboxy-muconic semialdehyde decarboxylase
MTDLALLKEDLVTANRILADHHVVDSFGHVAIRHPDQPDHYFLSRARAPDCIEIGDITEFTLDGRTVGHEPGKPYSELFIHGAIFEARPDVVAVVHNHSPNVVPFTVQRRRSLRPILHMAAVIGNDIPVWDIAHKFGATNLLVTSMEMGRDLAQSLGPRIVGLMRGHGSVVTGKSLREAVFTSVYLEINADMLVKALILGGEDLTYISDAEVQKALGARAGFTFERAWENWCRHVERPYYPQEWSMGPGFSLSDR